MLYHPVISKLSYPVESAPIWIMFMIQFRHPVMLLHGISHLEAALSCGDQFHQLENQKRVSGECCFFMTGWSPNALESSPCPRTKNRSSLWNQEQVFYSENGEPLNGQLVLCSFQPPTSDPGLFYNSQLASCN